MPNAKANGLTIEYETLGDPAHPALLLVMGLGAQLVYWPDEFCEALAARGFFVIRYDNRDVGLSSRIDDAPAPDLMAALGGDGRSAGYTLSDMAADGIGLLDALSIEAAHVVGVSMGGMIAQHMAIEHPARVRSLCSIMSAPTGVMAADPPTPEAGAILVRPAAATREEVIEQSVEAARVIGSSGFPFDEEYTRERATLAYDRAFFPLGLARQLVAIVASPPWVEALAAVAAPTVVIHGDADPLVRPSWGAATAGAISGAQLVTIPGMGHDLPRGAWAAMVDAIAANAARGM